MIDKGQARLGKDGPAFGGYRGYSKLRIHTVLGPYGRSIRTFLRAVRVLTFE